jgi:translation elongation factor EF-Tu-like GTPase
MKMTSFRVKTVRRMASLAVLTVLSLGIGLQTARAIDNAPEERERGITYFIHELISHLL